MAPQPKENSLIPSFIYSSSTPERLVIPAPKEKLMKIELSTPAFYAACTAGGFWSCGLTYMAVNPLHVVRCNMQMYPATYKSFRSTFGVLLKKQGIGGFYRGWSPTWLPYSIRGACKFGMYEFFKKHYSESDTTCWPEFVTKYQGWIYFASVMSAELIVDVAFLPVDAMNDRAKTWPGLARSFSNEFLKSRCAFWLRKGLPHTITELAFFEAIVVYERKNSPVSMDKCSMPVPLSLTFYCGSVIGAFSAVLFNLVELRSSYPYHAKGATLNLRFLTRGLPLRMVTIATLTGAQFTIYGAFKDFFGLPTAFGATPAPAN